MLVVGAGPVGVMAACSLALQGVPVRIVEKRGEASTESKALAMHARSLEVLDQLGHGVIDKFLEQGLAIKVTDSHPRFDSELALLRSN